MPIRDLTGLVNAGKRTYVSLADLMSKHGRNTSMWGALSAPVEQMTPEQQAKLRNTAVISTMGVPLVGPVNAAIDAGLMALPELPGTLGQLIQMAAGRRKPKVTYARRGQALPENEPPVADGMVRLYRGEGVGSPPSEHGAFFSGKRDVAEFYATNELFEPRRLVYVDVPKAELSRYDAYRHPEAEHMVGPGEDPYILPQELTEQRQELWRMRPWKKR